jgi:multisubunit Na+/H+ antiporter MnhB subunit
MNPALAADLIVVLHGAYVAFVVVGLVLILIGKGFGWRWVRNPWFRVAHLLAILIVAGEALFNIPCPLTVWETSLREQAGQTASEGTFIGSLVHNLLFIDAPEWAFTTAYVLFAAVVAATFWWVPPKKKMKDNG